MSETDRERIVRQERGRAAVRALWLSEFEAVGRERRKALALADRQVEKVGRLLQDALDSGLTISEIARLTGVSRPTLYELRARFAEDSGNLALGVIQAIANGRSRAEIMALGKGKGADWVREFMRTGLVEEDWLEGEDHPVPVLLLTDAGMRALEVWDIEDMEQEALQERAEAEQEDRTRAP